MRVLVTGGAGFIGSFLTDKLVDEGHNVCVLDNLEPQVHDGVKPYYLNESVNYIWADVKDAETVVKAVADVDVVFHEASLVGVGQSMYDIKRYVDANSTGTATLLDVLVNSDNNVKKLVVASSMSLYGEGSYSCSDCGIVYPESRNEAHLKEGLWEMQCPLCGVFVKPHHTDESKVPHPTSVYAISKRNQEEMCLIVGKSYGIPTVALRYFNVYGPRQSLSNPYTGVAAIFMSRLKNNKQPIVYEDGLQSRDFVSVHDIVQANLLAMDKSSADYEVFNVGSGRHVTILEIASILAEKCGKNIKPDVTNKFRKGDIRHCFADISKIRNKLGYQPKISFNQGINELISWSEGVEAKDMFDSAEEELSKKGLI